MLQSFRVTRLAWGSLVVMAAVALTAGRVGLGEDEPSTKKSAKKAEAAKDDAKPPEAKKKPKPKEVKGRLPAYYGEVVDQKQRDAIYAIQAEYAPKIDALKAQLDALEKERDEKVAAVLTEEQVKKVEALKEAAKAKRSEAKEAPAKPKAKSPPKPKED